MSETTPPPPARPHPALIALAGLLSANVLLRAWVSDDALITLRTVQNLLAGDGLTWNPGERVQAYTHPLWMLLTAGATTLTGAPAETVIGLGLVLTGASIVAGARMVRPETPAAAVALAALAGSASIGDFATSGLETPLHAFLVVLLFALVLRGGGAFGAGLLTSALLLTRPDAPPLVAPLVLLLGWRRGREDGVAPAVFRFVLGLAPLITWEVFSVVYYGFPVPNTAYAKLGAGVGAGELASRGAAYIARTLRWDPLLAVPLLVGPAWAAWRGRAEDRALALGIALHLAYVARVGGDFMLGRFLVVPACAGTLLLLRARPPSRPAALAAAALAGLAVVRVDPSLFDPALGGASFASIDELGFADERSFYGADSSLWRRGPGWPGRMEAADQDEVAAWQDDEWLPTLVEVGLLTPADEAAIRTAPAGTRPLVVRGAIGAIGFHSGGGVWVVDIHGLGDPLLARLPADLPDPLLGRFLPDAPDWRTGHYPRRVPEGYARTLLSGTNALADPTVAALYEDLRRVTMGPLFTRERWAAIVRLNGL